VEAGKNVKPAMSQGSWRTRRTEGAVRPGQRHPAMRKVPRIRQR